MKNKKIKVFLKEDHGIKTSTYYFTQKWRIHLTISNRGIYFRAILPGGKGYSRVLVDQARYWSV